MAKTLTTEQVAEKKAALIAVATKILEEEGLLALTLRRLAQDSGISRSTPYLYFKDKDDLLQDICAETFRYLIKQCRDAMAACTDDTSKVIAMGKCYLNFGIERPTLYHLIFAPKNPGDEVSPEVLEVVEEYKNMTEIPMQRAYDEGIFKYPPDRLNPVLWACSHGLLCLLWAGHLSEEGVYERVEEDMGQILGVGFIDTEKYDENYGSNNSQPSGC